MQSRERDDRRDWIIVILIILFGLLCILLAGGWALRLHPSWQLDSNMGSKLNPNSDFLTARLSNGLIEPIDASILTQPSWMGLYLTPGASFQTGTPFPTKIKNTLPAPATQTPPPVINVTPTKTVTPAIIINPTNTTRASNPTSTPIPVKSADLRITITDSSTTYIVGGTRTYSIVVSNLSGSTNVNGATVVDNFPSILSGITWTCIGSNGATCKSNGIGNINEAVNLPAGSFVTYTVNANVSSVATGNLINTASVTPPASVPDPALANNTVTDTDTPIFNVDLQITKTDGVATYIPGNSVTYSIVVINTGPANATGATVTDIFPVQASSVNWSCAVTGGASCTASGTGNINDTVNIPVSGTVTYMATVNILASATGNMTNTATVTEPGGYTDTIPGNNSATDTDTPNLLIDLAITKTDGNANYIAGNPISYTIVVTNAGPSNAVGANVTDAVPAAITGITVNCAANGSANCGTNASAGNNVSYTGVDIPVGPGNFLTITVSGTVNAGTTGNLTNTAIVSAGATQTDSTPGNNTATDTDTPSVVDMQITLTDNATDYAANATKIYTIVVSNAGPSNAVGATVTDIFSTNINIATANWTCLASGGATCTAGGFGNLNDTVTIPVGSTLTYTVTTTIVGSPLGNLVNTASVSGPAGTTDSNNGNNSATDTDTLITVDILPGPIGTTPDGVIYDLMSGGTLTLPLNLVANGDSAWDLVYYERPAGSGVLLDWIVVQIGDGNNWYTVFNWGDNIRDRNTNMDFAILSIPVTPPTPEEVDQRDVATADLYNGTGIAIDIDAIVSPGTYSFIRFYAPPGDVDGHTEIDAIQVLP